MCLPFSLTGLQAAGFYVCGFMKAACCSCWVLSSSCLLWFSFDGSHRFIMVSECHLFFMFFCRVCMSSGYALSRIFVCVLHPYGFPDAEHEGVAGNISTSAVVIVKHLKNRNGVASPCRTTCTVCGDAPCYAFLSIQLYVALCRSAAGFCSDVCFLLSSPYQALSTGRARLCRYRLHGAGR